MSRKKKASESIEKQHNKKSENKIEHTISFDAWFSNQLRTGKNFAHHKAPMKNFAKASGIMEATKKEFDKLFESY